MNNVHKKKQGRQLNKQPLGVGGSVSAPACLLHRETVDIPVTSSIFRDEKRSRQKRKDNPLYIQMLFVIKKDDL